MTALIIIGAILGYLGVGLTAARVSFLLLLKDSKGRTDDDDKFMSLMTGAFWPLAAVIFALYGISTGAGALISMPTRKQRRELKLEEMKKEARRVQLHIEQLEKELL